jgi:hypothetical protein
MPSSTTRCAAPSAGCAPGNLRCYGFPYTVEDALLTLDQEGWCRIGWVAGRSGRDDWEVWFHVDRGEVRYQGHSARG